MGAVVCLSYQQPSLTAASLTAMCQLKRSLLVRTCSRNDAHKLLSQSHGGLRSDNADALLSVATKLTGWQQQKRSAPPVPSQAGVELSSQMV